MMKDGIVCLYKPKGMTSFDAVFALKKKFKVKTGHSGTLDPEAEGVLVVAVNKATKALPFLNVSDKVYEASLKLGIQTDTGDIWGVVVDEQPVAPLDVLNVKAILTSFIGKHRQRVPMVSAKKVRGKKLYEYHRDQQVVETVYTDIEIFDLECLFIGDDTIRFRAHVSNGTYIRTLCEDIATSLGTVGTMASLIRVKVGSFSLEDAHTLDAIDDLDVVLLETKAHINLPRIEDASFKETMLHGKRLLIDRDDPLLLVDAGEIYAVCEKTEVGDYKVKRGLW